MATREQIDTLLNRMREMSPADISVLEASTKTPDSNMATAPGSANEALWTEFEQLGWISSRNEDLELPAGSPFHMKIYSITSEGLQPILDLLAKLSNQ